MKTVKEVSRLTGVSVRTLHHYDAIGLLSPTKVTEAGYRLYDDRAMERLCLIIVWRELGFSLKEIREILDSPDFDRDRALEQQVALLEAQREYLQHRIEFARAMIQTGGTHMSLKDFNKSTMDDRRAQAKALWGKTDAYREYEEKSVGRNAETENALGAGLMALFGELGTLRGEGAGSEAVQSWVARLQGYISANYYTCTKQILAGLGEMYAAGDSMTENIDAVGGPGTGEFAREAIRIFCGL